MLSFSGKVVIYYCNLTFLQLKGQVTRRPVYGFNNFKIMHVSLVKLPLIFSECFHVDKPSVCRSLTDSVEKNSTYP